MQYFSSISHQWCWTCRIIIIFTEYLETSNIVGNLWQISSPYTIGLILVHPNQSVYWFNTQRPRPHLHSMHLRKIILCFDSSFAEVCLNGPTDNKSSGNSLAPYSKKPLPRSTMTRNTDVYDYSEVIMSVIASQITGFSTVCSTVGLGTMKTTMLCVTILCVGNSPVTGERPVTRKCFHLMTSSGNIYRDDVMKWKHVFIHVRHLRQWVTSYEDSWQLQT